MPKAGDLSAPNSVQVPTWYLVRQPVGRDPLNSYAMSQEKPAPIGEESSLTPGRSIPPTRPSILPGKPTLLPYLPGRQSLRNQGR